MVQILLKVNESAKHRSPNQAESKSSQARIKPNQAEAKIQVKSRNPSRKPKEEPAERQKPAASRSQPASGEAGSCRGPAPWSSDSQGGGGPGRGPRGKGTENHGFSENSRKFLGTGKVQEPPEVAKCEPLSLIRMTGGKHKALPRKSHLAFI